MISEGLLGVRIEQSGDQFCRKLRRFWLQQPGGVCLKRQIDRFETLEKRHSLGSQEPHGKPDLIPPIKRIRSTSDLKSWNPPNRSGLRNPRILRQNVRFSSIVRTSGQLTPKDLRRAVEPLGVLVDRELRQRCHRAGTATSLPQEQPRFAAS